MLGQVNRDRGIKQVESEDGHTVPALIAGEACRTTRPGRHEERYVYFQIDDSFKSARAMDAMVDVDYFDGDRGTFSVQYDSHDPAAVLNGAYKDCAERVSLQGSHAWETARFVLDGARFEGSQNAGADFRIAASGADLSIRRVCVRPKEAP